MSMQMAIRQCMIEQLQVKEWVADAWNGMAWCDTSQLIAA